MDIGKMTLHQLCTARESIIDTAVDLKGKLGLVQDEINRRLTGQVMAAFAEANKVSGTLTIPLEDGLTAKADIEKTVKWDSEKLMAIAFSLPVGQAKTLFKFEVSVPEKMYDGTKAANPDLGIKIDEARTVTHKLKPIALKVDE